MNKQTKHRSKASTFTSHSNSNNRTPLQNLNGCFSFLMSPSPSKNNTKTTSSSHFDHNPKHPTPQNHHQSHGDQLGPPKIPSLTHFIKKNPHFAKRPPSPVHSSCSSCSGPSPDSNQEVASVCSVNHSGYIEQGKIKPLSELHTAIAPHAKRKNSSKAGKASPSCSDRNPYSEVNHISKNWVASSESKQSGMARSLSEFVRLRASASDSNISSCTSTAKKAAKFRGGCDLTECDMPYSGLSSRFKRSLALNHPWNVAILSAFSFQIDCCSSVNSCADQKHIGIGLNSDADRILWHEGLIGRIAEMEEESECLFDGAHLGSFMLCNGSVHIDGERFWVNPICW